MKLEWKEAYDILERVWKHIESQLQKTTDPLLAESLSDAEGIVVNCQDQILN